MDIGLNIRPTGSVAQTSAVTPASTPVRQAVPTVLAPSQSVTAATDADPAENKPQQPTNTQQLADPSGNPNISQSVIIDPETRQVIYRTLDVRSGQVIRQQPDKLMLSMTAYNQAIAKGLSPAEAEARADIKL
ncbi:MAG TPA: hypothetical protein VHN11_10925 [Xanthobacteraceae bacterium]|nr:hypothetical protein [Xanthobacteraceae bacterium]